MTYGRQQSTNREINWVTDEDGNVLGYMKDPKTLIGLDAPVDIGPISSRTNLPKASAYPRYMLSTSRWPLGKSGTYIELCFAMLSQPGESMKAGPGYTNGYGDIVSTVIHRGNKYNANTEFMRCDFGDVLFVGVSIPTGFDQGDFIDVLNYVEQSPHNAPLPAAASGQFMTFMNFIPAWDKSYAANSLTHGQRETWKKAVIDGVFPPSSLTGVGVVHNMSFRPVAILGYTSDETDIIFGTSREQGSDTPMLGSGVNAFGAADFFHNGYGIGECQTILGAKRGIVNLGISSEKAENIITADAVAGRKKIVEHCQRSRLVYTHGINDLSALTQVTAFTTMLGWYNAWLGLMPSNRDVCVATVGYRGSTSDYVTTLAGQSRNASYAPIKTYNDNVRALNFPNQVAYIETVLGPSNNQDQGRLPVPAYAQVVNTGSGSIVQAAATASLPDRTILTWNTAIFKPEHHGAYITILAAGPSSAVLRAQIEWPDVSTADRADVWLVVREGPLNRIPTTMLLGGAGAVGNPLALTAPTNTLYIGSEEMTNDMLHLSKRGNQALLKRNASEGLI